MTGLKVAMVERTMSVCRPVFDPTTTRRCDPLTLAEQLFERYCRWAGIRATRIPTSTTKTPDYRMSVGDLDIIVELKQLDPNEEEKAELARFDQGKSGGYSAVPGNRLRREISKAGTQLATIARNQHPSMVVFYNNVFLRFHTDPYNVRVAMYGVEQVVVAVSSDPRIRTRYAGTKFGPKRKMTSQHNTTISAVGVLILNPPGDLQSPQLIVYHNIYARHPLSSEVLRPYGVPQFTLPEGSPNSSREWIEA